MSVDLGKFKDTLQDAWNDVLNDKSKTDWALFGYEKTTNSLQVVGTGDGGVEELIDELNSGKIMYAFCRVIDPKTSLNKFVFINWQGEGAPIARKGVCAGHVKDVLSMIKGAHITINARTEDDVEPQVILEQVANASASQFNFKDRSDPTEQTAPIGSVYKRIQPIKEINPSERERFWEKEQAEEKQRVLDEKRKVDAERKRLEFERKERERKETAVRDEAVKERSRSIKQAKEFQKIAEQKDRIKQQEKVLWEKQLQDDADDEKERRVRSESLRKERSCEASNLIAQRTINARAIFERNTSAGQLSSIQASKQSNVVENDELEPNNEVVQEEEKKEVVPEVQKRFREARLQRCSHMEVSPSPTDVNKHFQFSRNPTEEKVSPELKTNPEELNGSEELQSETAKSDSVQPERIEIDEELTANFQDNVQIVATADDGLRARALYDYQAADDTEISFDPDDIITQVEQIDEGWWQGQGPDGTYGLFPANYVELLD